MNRGQLRRRLDALSKEEFGLPGLPSVIWQQLDRDGLIEDARLGEAGWPDVQVFAGDRLRVYVEGRNDRRDAVSSGEGSNAGIPEMAAERERPHAESGQAESTPELEGLEADRARAISEAVAKYAACRRRVRRFRERFLGGRVLSEAEARAFVASPALAILLPHTCEAWGIPFLGHVAKAERLAGHDGEQVSIHVSPPGITRRVRCTRQTRLVLSTPGANEERHAVEVQRHSVLDELRRAAVELADRCDWPEAEAAWFILTGAVPSVAPLRVGLKGSYGSARNTARVTLSVEPWVSAETVQRAYRDVQRRVLGRTDNRPIGRRNLALFRLAIQHAQGADSPPHRELSVHLPPYRELMDRWNALHPATCDHKQRHDDTCRYDDERRLGGDFLRAWRALMRPPYSIR
jgi:hypothetical protein